MNKQEAVDFIRRYFEALKRDKQVPHMKEFIAEELLMQHIAFFDAAFPGYWLDAEDVLADGDEIAVRFTFHGTHKGELMGIAPTFKTVAFEGLIIYRLANDKIVEHWMQVDTASMLQQLGAMPVPA